MMNWKLRSWWSVSRHLRVTIQLVYLLLTLWAGWSFYGFYLDLLAGPYSTHFRYPLVEGFLPISALLALRMWFFTGLVDPIHPAGMFILITILISTLFVGRAFCSWICPVGTVSDYLYSIGKVLLKKFNLKPYQPGPVVSFLLSSIKYLLLIFFLYITWIALPLEEIPIFINTPYNQVVDFKMLDFFLEPGMITIIVILVLTLLSLWIPNFWCRFSCPYGALMGWLAKFQVIKLKRDIESCTDCQKCSIACPNGLKPHTVKTMRKENCTLCLSCIKECPHNSITLHVFKYPFKSHWTFTIVAISLLLLFIGISEWAKYNGYWYSQLTVEDYRRWLPELKNLQHY